MSRRKINLNGFCPRQIDYWEAMADIVEKEHICKKCKQHNIRMVSKWTAKCSCGAKYKIDKPKSFPKNSGDTSKWTTKCECCGAVMRYTESTKYRNAFYSCTKCSFAFEV